MQCAFEKLFGYKNYCLVIVVRASYYKNHGLLKIVSQTWLKEEGEVIHLYFYGTLLLNRNYHPLIILRVCFLCVVTDVIRKVIAIVELTVRI